MCGCCKKGSFCGPGCLCQGCTNLPASSNSDLDDGSTGSESEASDKYSSDDMLTEEIVTDDFDFEITDI